MKKIALISEYTIGYNFSGMFLQLQKIKENCNSNQLAVELFNIWRCGERKYDLVHVFGYNHSIFQLIDILTKKNVRYIVSPNSSPSENVFIKKLLSYLFIKNGFISSRPALQQKILENAELIIVNSSIEKNYLIKAFRLNGKIIDVIPNGVEKSFENGNPELFRKKFNIHQDFVLTVGETFNRTKNHYKLLQSWSRDNPKLVFVGNILNDAYSKKCKKLADKLGNVKIVGPMDHEGSLLKSAYKACSAFVLPSVSETTGLSALEAAISGAPIAITERGGTKEYFQNKVNYCNPNSLESISNAVTKAIEQGRCDIRAKYFSELFDWESISNRYTSIYQDILSKN